MPLEDYLVGVAYLGVTAGSVLIAAGLVVLRRLRHLDGAAMVLAFAILATTGLLVVHLAPGLAGVLSRASALLCAIALLVAAVLLTRGHETRRVHLPRRPVELGGLLPRGLGGVSVAAVVVGGAVVACWSVAAAWSGTVLPSGDIDTLTFHLPNVAKWIQTGSMWRADQFIPLLGNGNYPQNGDAVMLTVVLPFENDAFVRAAGLPFAGVAALSVYALATEAGARRACAVVFAAAYAALPVFMLATYEGAKTDPIMLACFGAGTYFLLRSLRDGHRSSVVLAGLGLGLAFGTKWYGVWSVAVVVLVWGCVWLAARRPWRGLAVAGGWVGALIVLAGGVWLLRNAVKSGSPLYPSAVRPLGITLFDAPRDLPRECGGSTVAGYLTDLDVLREHILPAYREGFRAPGLVLGLGWALGALMILRRLRGPGRLTPTSPVVALTAMVPLLVLAYSLTPYSALGAPGEPFVQANLRWLLPAFLPAAAVAAWAVSNLGARLRVAAEALAAASVIVAIRDGIPLPLGTVAGVTAGLLGALLLAAGVIWLARSGNMARRVGAGVLCGLAVIFLVMAGDRRRERFNRDRYAGDAVVQLLASAETRADRVGLAGVWTRDGISPVLPAFGPRLRRHVDFVGYMTDGQLREYETRRAFLAQVRHGDYDLLVVGRGLAAYGGCRVPGSESDEDAWAREEGFPLLAQTGRLSLYEVLDSPQ